jgi:sialate O-acetylesterase
MNMGHAILNRAGARLLLPAWALLAAATCCAQREARAAVRVHSLFADHMVIQRKMPIRVWGLADPGEEVSVSIAGRQASTRAGKDGRWQVELPSMEKGEGLVLTVKGSNTVSFKDVIVGDVWVCGGQSNMNMPLNYHVRRRRDPEAAADIKAADFPKIRRVKIGPNAPSYFCEEHAPIGTPWERCSPQSAARFTAAGFYFAREIYRKTGVPIGLLDSNRGGTIIESWMPIEAVKGKPEAVYPERLDRMSRWLAAARKAFDEKRLPDSDGVRNPPAPSISAKSLRGWERWVPRFRAALRRRQLVDENGKCASFPPKLVARWGKDSSVIAPINWKGMAPSPAPCWWGKARPGCLYRGMIHPLLRFPIKGVIWYQGESNALGRNGDPQYGRTHAALIRGWRKAWGQGDFPFYFVQLPGWPWNKVRNTPAGGRGWNVVREAQLKSLSIPNTGMAVTVDIGDKDIHPPNKYDVGLRLARWALARDYGFEKLVPIGPVYKSMKVEGEKIRLFFDYADSGLMVGAKKGRAPVVEDKAAKLKWFAVAGADKNFVWAEAVVDGKTVVVSSPEVKKPVAVRYAYCQNPAGANLYNRDGLPASPFRTDK